MAINQFIPNNQKDPRFQPRLPDTVQLQGDVPAVYYSPTEIDLTDTFKTAGNVVRFAGSIQAQREKGLKDAKTELKNTILNDYILSQDELMEGYAQNMISPTEYAMRQRALRDEYLLKAGGLINGKDFLTAEGGITGANVQGLLIKQQFEDIKAQKARDRKVYQDMLDNARSENPGLKYASDEEVSQTMTKAAMAGDALTKAFAQDAFRRTSSGSLVTVAPSAESREAASNVADFDLNNQLFNIFEEYKGQEIPSDVYQEAINNSVSSLLNAPNNPFTPTEAYQIVLQAASRNGYTTGMQIAKNKKAEIEYELGHRKFVADINQQDFERVIKNTRELKAFTREQYLSQFPLVEAVNSLDPESQKMMFTHLQDVGMLETWRDQMTKYLNAVATGADTSMTQNSVAGLPQEVSDWLTQTAAATIVGVNNNFANVSPVTGYATYLQGASNSRISTTPNEVIENKVNETKLGNAKEYNKLYENAVDSGKYDKDMLGTMGVQYMTNKTAEAQHIRNTILGGPHKNQLRYDEANNRFVYVAANEFEFRDGQVYIKGTNEHPTMEQLQEVLWPQAWKELSDLNNTINNPYLKTLTDVNGQNKDMTSTLGGFIAAQSNIPSLGADEVVAKESAYSEGFRNLLGGSAAIYEGNVREGFERMIEGGGELLKNFFGDVKEAASNISEKETDKKAYDTVTSIAEYVNEFRDKLTGNMSAKDVVEVVFDIIEKAQDINESGLVDKVINTSKGLAKKVLDFFNPLTEEEKVTNNSLKEIAEMDEDELNTIVDNVIAEQQVALEEEAMVRTAETHQALQQLNTERKATEELEELPERAMKAAESDLERRMVEARNSAYPSIPFVNLKTIDAIMNNEGGVSPEQAKAALLAYNNASMADKRKLDKRYNIGIFSQNIKSKLQEASKEKGKSLIDYLIPTAGAAEYTPSRNKNMIEEVAIQNIPEEIRKDFKRITESFGVSQLDVLDKLAAESSMGTAPKLKTQSGNGAQGIMQVTKIAEDQLKKEKDLQKLMKEIYPNFKWNRADPMSNFVMGVAYMKYVQDRVDNKLKEYKIRVSEDAERVLKQVAYKWPGKLDSIMRDIVDTQDSYHWIETDILNDEDRTYLKNHLYTNFK